MPLTKTQPKIYTNPSWAMAIESQDSPLSRWWGKSLTQMSGGFTLQLKPTEDSQPSRDRLSGRPILVRGNQEQLEALAQLTEEYVRSLLKPALVSASPKNQVVDSAGDGDVQTGLISQAQIMAERDRVFSNDAPEWQGESVCCHHLYLGSLEVEPIVSELRVTTSQLYDLSEILCQSLKALQPQVGSTRALPLRSFASAKTAAVAAIAVGLTGSLTWLVMGGPEFQIGAGPREEDVETSIASGPLDDELQKLPDFPVQPDTPSSSASQPQKPGTQKKTTIPKTNKPTFNLNPAPKVDTSKRAIASNKLAQSDKVAPPPTPSPAPTKKDLTSASKDSSLEETTKQATSPSPTTPKDTLQDASGKPGPASISPDNKIEPAPQISDNATPPPTSNPGTVASAPTQNSQSASEPLPPSAETSVPAAARQQAPSSFGVGALSRSDVVSRPSLESVTDFFESQWRGQDDLEQSLSYTIKVKSDGTVAAVTPKDQLASARIKQTPVPQTGAPLTQPFGNASPVTYTVTLYPDGTVSVK